MFPTRRWATDQCASPASPERIVPWRGAPCHRGCVTTASRSRRRYLISPDLEAAERIGPERRGYGDVDRIDGPLPPTLARSAARCCVGRRYTSVLRDTPRTKQRSPSD